MKINFMAYILNFLPSAFFQELWVIIIAAGDNEQPQLDEIFTQLTPDLVVNDVASIFVNICAP